LTSLLGSVRPRRKDGCNELWLVFASVSDLLLLSGREGAMKAISSAILLIAVLAAACGEKVDTRKNVSEALEEANLPHVAVDVDDESKIVHLKGTVGTMSEKTRAEEVAAAAVGTSGRVLNELTVEGLSGRAASDLDAELLDALDRMVDDDEVLRERDVNFEVVNGTVTATGEVRSAAEKNQVTRIVKSAPGVKDFTNALEIHPEQ
jgi:osmotically-inducible protein OsmY